MISASLCADSADRSDFRLSWSSLLRWALVPTPPSSRSCGGVLIKPLVNRDEDRLVYIRQSAPGMGNENSTWSMPEIGDLKARVKAFSEFGDFSTIAFTIIGLGEPREVNGGVVNGSFFDVMGLRPVLGRLMGPQIVTCSGAIRS